MQRPFGKRWVDVVASDWAMTGAPIGSMISYFKPEAFRYYLPSLLLGAVRDEMNGERTISLEYSLSALLPSNQRYISLGKSWNEFFNGFSNEQRMAVQAFPKFVYASAHEGSADKYQAGLGIETIWLGQ